MRDSHPHSITLVDTRACIHGMCGRLQYPQQTSSCPEPRTPHKRTVAANDANMKVDTCDTVGRHARQKHSRDLSTLRQDRNLQKFRMSGQRTFRLKLFFHVQAHQANLVCEGGGPVCSWKRIHC